MTSDFDYSSTTVPPGALFVAADEPLQIYPSVAAVERHLEAIDVEDGVYPVAYGPNGEPFRIGSEDNRVIIEPTGEPNRPDELRLLLLRYLEATDARRMQRRRSMTWWQRLGRSKATFGNSMTRLVTGSGRAFLRGDASPS